MASANGTALRELNNSPAVEHFRGTAGFVVWQFLWHHVLKSHFAKLDSAAYDVVHVMYFDDFDKSTAVLGSPFGKHPFSGLLMNVRFHHAKVGVPCSRSRWDPLYRMLFVRLLRVPQFRVILSTDPTLEPYAAAQHGLEWQKVKSVSDFGAPIRKRDRANARLTFGIPSGACVVLVYGTLTSRKGLQMLNAALALDACPRHVIGLVAGRIAASGRPATESDVATTLRKNGRLLLIDRFLSDEEEGDAFAAADLVWLGYERFHSLSGVLFQAMQADRPVLAQDYGLIAWLASRHRLGISVDTRDPLKTASLLADFSANPAPYQPEPHALASCLRTYNEDTYVDGVVTNVLGCVRPRPMAQDAAISPPPSNTHLPMQ